MKKVFIGLIMVAMTLSTTSFAYSGSTVKVNMLIDVNEHSISACPNGCKADVLYNTTTGIFECTKCHCKWKLECQGVIRIIDTGIIAHLQTV